MNINKIIGLSSKVLVAILGIVGVVMCVTVMKDGNPNDWSEQTKYDVGQVIVSKTDAPEKLSAPALEAKVIEEGKKMHEVTLERQKGNAKSTLVFTSWLLIIAIAFIVIALVFAIILAPKRFIIPGIAIVVFIGVLYAIYNGVGSEVPAGLVQMDADKMANSALPVEPVFTESSWRLGGAAIVSSLVLIGIAVAGIVVSSVVKLVK